MVARRDGAGCQVLHANDVWLWLPTEPIAWVPLPLPLPLPLPVSVARPKPVSRA
jgi:hypothetical protein